MNRNPVPIEILLVEDNPGDILLTRKIFETHKIKNNLSIVLDGIEALDFLHKRGEYTGSPVPDIILLDLKLPHKDGFEVLEEIQANRNLAKIPVFIFTEHATEDNINRLLHLGAKYILPKPLELYDFIMKVNELTPYWINIVTTI
jgi:CheY-like chemotaxis protein